MYSRPSIEFFFQTKLHFKCNWNCIYSLILCINFGKTEEKKVMNFRNQSERAACWNDSNSINFAVLVHWFKKKKKIPVFISWSNAISSSFSIDLSSNSSAANSQNNSLLQSSSWKTSLNSAPMWFLSLLSSFYWCINTPPPPHLPVLESCFFASPFKYGLSDTFNNKHHELPLPPSCRNSLEKFLNHVSLQVL